ncbi:MAG: Na/Pi cotransporter family protein [Elusimicrobiota bacterium]
MEKIIFGVIGGLGLFIFGMKFLSEGLQKIGSLRIRRMLRSLTDNKLMGVSLGAFVTSIVQSSSVTTVILIGLINAGIINLVQAASVVIGANIGTTITAQIIAFKISKYALPGIGIGMLIMLIARRRKVKFWGEVILALGIIFLGLSTMSDVVKPLRDIPAVTDFFVLISKNGLLAILIGALFTVVIQSSSASIGLLIALAIGGLIDFKSALYILLGTNIGTTVTAWLASIGGTVSARRMACFHSLFNILGSIYFGFLIYFGVYEKFIMFVTPGKIITTENIARYIANAHTFFNIINAVVFLPLVGIIIVIIKKLIPGEETYVSIDMKYLQDSLLNTPAVALESTKKEIAEMAKMSRKVLKTAVDGFFNRDKQSVHHVITQEDAIDHIQRDITFYIAKISTDTLTEELSSQLPVYLHSINDIERISDHAVNIAEKTDAVIGEEAVLSDTALQEIKSMYDKIELMFERSIQVINSFEKKLVEDVIRLEKEVNADHKSFLNEHAARLVSKQCTAQGTLIFIDIINNLEKVADHLTNIAQAAGGHFYFSQVKKFNVDEDPVLAKI